MASLSSFVVDDLVSLVHDVIEARLGVPEVEARLPNILRALPDLEFNPGLRPELLLFVAELISEHVVPDRLPLRKAALARIAWRTDQIVDPTRATLLGLFATFLLQTLNAHDEALALIELVEADARRTDDPLLRAAISIRVDCLGKLQHFEEAHQVALEYESSALVEPTDVVELHMINRSTIAGANAGHIDIALKRARRAVELFEMGPEKVPDEGLLSLIFEPLDAAEVYKALGDVLRRSDDHLGAIDAYQQGRTKSLQSGNRVGAAWCLSEIAITWDYLSEFQRGALLLQQAAWEAEQAGDARAAARWRNQRVPGEDGAADMKGVNGLAAVYHMLQTQGPSEELERLTKEIITAERGTGTTIEPIARNLLAGIYSAGEKYELALSAVSAAVAIADKLHEKWLALSFRCNQAQILFNKGLLVSANDICDRIFNDADNFLSEAGTSEIRQAAVSAVSLATEIALVIASADTELQSGETRPHDPQRVLSTIDRTHGRTFNRWLALTSWSQRTGSSDIVAATHELIAADVAVEWTAYAARPMRTALEKRKLAEKTLIRVAGDASVTLPESHGVGALPDPAAGLPMRTAILGLTAVESGIVCLSFESGKPARTEHLFWERKSRMGWLERFRSAQSVEARQMGVASAGDASDAREADDIEKLYEELRSVFADPLATWLGRDVDHLIVAMHAELAPIPLWGIARALPDVALSVVPTLRSVALLAARSESAGQVNIAVGDATGSLRMAPRELELLRGYTNIAPDVEELQRVAPHARRIHFAGHGEFDSDNPYSSGLILQGVNRPPHAIASTYVGCVRLTIAGILQWLDVADCELITISACSVSAPRTHAASEFTSVPTAFLLAGARNVLAAGWPVHDAATTLLMNHFYSSLESGENAATALSAARQKLSRTTRNEANAILGRDDVIPPGNLPFASSIFTDAFMLYGTGWSLDTLHSAV